MKLKRTSCAFLKFCISTLLFACAVCLAQQRCSIEVKLLLSPDDIPAIVGKLKAQNQSSGGVYFFDTEKRELLSQGVIIRVRHSSTRDLTIKLRPLNEKSFEDPTNGKENFKCEEDLTANEVNLSFSIRNSLAGSQIPETGNDIYRALSDGQRTFLRLAQVTIDWSQVKRVADIEETDWQIKLDSGSKKLTLELWKWPGGQILELSTRTVTESGAVTYAELHELALDRGLKLSPDQRSKTRMLLESRPMPVAH
jgi:hypothetical protein